MTDGLTLDKLLAGYSDPSKGRIVTLEGIQSLAAGPDDVSRLTTMDPMVYRYLNVVEDVNDAASLIQLSRDRLTVAVEALIMLADVMADYDGMHRDQKVIDVQLTDEQREMLRAIPGEFTFDNQKQVEFIDGIARHDLGATMDWLKIQLLTRSELGLKDYAESVHYNLTSEDVNSVAFGMMSTTILRRAVLPAIVTIQEQIIEYALRYESLVIGGLTHGQPAEFTTLGKRFMNVASAIDNALQKFVPFNEVGNRVPLLFSGKIGGAIGNLSDHRSSYPDIDWPAHMRDLVEDFGLQYEPMTGQCHSFQEHQYVCGLLKGITTTLEKFGKDLWMDIMSSRYNKLAKSGDKGSSIMAQKKNPWMLEGGLKAMAKGMHTLEWSTRELRLFAQEGDMGRSYITRDIGCDYARIVLGIARIGRELSQYVPNEDNIAQFIEDNPGMHSAAIMGVLKRARVGGDAYRLMQSLSYDKATSRNKTRAEYEGGLKDLISMGAIAEDVASEILELLDPENNLGYARELTTQAKEKCLATIATVKVLYGIGEGGKETAFQGG